MKICIATSTRADWGLLQPVAQSLRACPNVEVQILATNMHLMEEYGMTVKEIEEAGFEVSARVRMKCEDGTAGARVKAMAQCMEGCAEELPRLQPDILAVLGDRYEMLAVASAAAVLGIPIAHIAGGETSEGAIDDRLRHAITQLSTLHFTAAEPYRQRVAQMLGTDKNVYNCGALGVWNIANQPLMSIEELSQSLDFELEAGKYFVTTFHPATLDTGASPAERCQAMLDALDRYPDYKVILTYPNNDTGSEEIIQAINHWAQSRPRVLLIKSLGMTRYLSAAKNAAAVIGNSSSGIVEVPSLGVPTIDIGIRQKGRLCGPSVLHCGDTADDTANAIATALSPQHQVLSRLKQNPYHRPDTVTQITTHLLNYIHKLYT
ncbi:MAG: UDP-N-acetylglucosamine 2-epimerase [Bacteroidales bacterium]|nr:UDP-N-acetylglucosamine 2-epimerase [Bacteroidales bacterium]